MERAALSFTVIGQPANGTLAGSGPNLTYTPNADFNGTDSLIFEASDGQASSAPATVTLSVSPVNDAPVAVSQALSVDQGEVLSLTLGGSDVDGDPLTFTVVAPPERRRGDRGRAEARRHIGAFARKLLSGPLPWVRMRQAQALIRMCDRYGDDHVNAVCARAISFEVYEVPRLERLLKQAGIGEDRGAGRRQGGPTARTLRPRRGPLRHPAAERRRCRMKTPTLSAELMTALKRLRLGGMIATLPERIAIAKKDDTPFDELLLMLVTDEIERRRSTAATRRATKAGLDPDMVVERWDKTAKVHYDRRVFQELCSLRFVEDARNVVILGPVGVGKTFLVGAIGHLACRSGFNVRFHRADALLRKLKQSRLDNSRDALMTELIAIDLLIIDDFALEPMNREESRDVYQLFVERTGRAATVVTSNRDTAEWLATFDDTLLAQSGDLRVTDDSVYRFSACGDGCTRVEISDRLTGALQAGFSIPATGLDLVLLSDGGLLAGEHRTHVDANSNPWDVPLGYRVSRVRSDGSLEPLFEHRSRSESVSGWILIDDFVVLVQDTYPHNTPYPPGHYLVGISWPGLRPERSGWLTPAGNMSSTWVPELGEAAPRQ